jgi:hypothetical protein
VFASSFGESRRKLCKVSPGLKRDCYESGSLDKDGFS